MIPKKLHYVWIGDGDPPEPYRTYIEGWSKACPGWEIRRWGMDDLNGTGNVFAKEAAAVGKWAFASDCLRLYALAREGGFYLDTDVELKGSLEAFRGNSLCMGLNLGGYPQTALIGAEPHQPLIEELIGEYARKRFILAEGCYDETANNTRFFRMFKRHGVNLKALSQEGENEVMPGVRFYPSSLLCRPRGGLPNIAWHHNNGTWLEPYRRKSVVDLPFGLRIVRMKRRRCFEGKRELNLLPTEKLIASFRVRRMEFAIVKRVKA